MNSENLSALKEASLAHCAAFVSGRLDRINRQTKEISEALTSETKSSAGDKHETGRAMLQLEREKLGAQLAEAEKMQALLHKVRAQTISKSIGLGALVLTTGHCYFLSVSAGELTHDGQKVYCISPATPIGKLVFGKVEGDSFTFLNKEYKILTVK